MTQGEKIIELLEKLVNISAENTNLQLELLDKLELLRINSMNTAKNTNEVKHLFIRRGVK